jgi:hypothetical protein
LSRPAESQPTGCRVSQRINCYIPLIGRQQASGMLHPLFRRQEIFLERR